MRSASLSMDTGIRLRSAADGVLRTVPRERPRWRAKGYLWCELFSWCDQAHPFNLVTHPNYWSSVRTWRERRGIWWQS